MAKPTKWPQACEIKHEDLQHLRALHQLLLALNDPLVSRSKLQMLTASMPTLAARVVHQAKGKWPSIDSLAEALQRVGNRGLERALLEFLEDLTIYKADLEDPPAPCDVPLAATGATVRPEKAPVVASVPDKRLTSKPDRKV